jgi:hypothetical protein
VPRCCCLTGDRSKTGRGKSKQSMAWVLLSHRRLEQGRKGQKQAINGAASACCCSTWSPPWTCRPPRGGSKGSHGLVADRPMSRGSPRAASCIAQTGRALMDKSSPGRYKGQLRKITILPFKFTSEIILCSYIFVLGPYILGSGPLLKFLPLRWFFVFYSDLIYLNGWL